MAPEQARGRTREIDGQTDLWAVGATMFVLLSGQYVHDAENADEFVIKTATERARPLRAVAAEIPHAICSVVDRALAFRKEDRWPDAASMRTALKQAHASATKEAIAETFAALRGAVENGHEGQMPITTGMSTAALDSVQSPPVSSDEKSVGETGLRAAATRTSTRHLRAQGHARAPALARTVAWVAAGMFVAAAFAGALKMTGHSRKGSPSTAPLPTASPNREALASFRLADQAWHDASIQVARASYNRAIEQEPGMGAAHLRLAVLDVWPDATSRKHYQDAIAYRSQLSDAERALLDVRIPPHLITESTRT